MGSRFLQRMLGGDLSGLPFKGSVNKVGGVTVSAFIKTLLDDVDAAAARSTLQVTGGTGVSGIPDFATITPPDALSNWTVINNSGSPATIEDKTVTSGAAIRIYEPGRSGNNIRMIVKSAPATPYTVTALLRIQAQQSNDNIIGLVFRQSSDGKFCFFNQQYSSGWLLNNAKWNSPTNWSANYTQQSEPFSSLLWMRIADNGTSRICSWSLNGQDFFTFHTVGRTDFLTADQIGVGFDVNDGASGPAAQAYLLSWAVT